MQANNKKSAFWKLSARVEREGDVIRLVLNPGPSGDVYKTLKEYKITQLSEEENLYLKRIIKNNFVICEERIKGSAEKSDKDIVSIIQSLHIAKKVNRDKWKVDLDYIRTQFANEKSKKSTGKKAFNKNKNNATRKPIQKDKFSPAQNKYNSHGTDSTQVYKVNKVIIPKGGINNENNPYNSVVKKKVKKIIRIVNRNGEN